MVDDLATSLPIPSRFFFSVRGVGLGRLGAFSSVSESHFSRLFAVDKNDVSMKKAVIENTAEKERRRRKKVYFHKF